MLIVAIDRPNVSLLLGVVFSEMAVELNCKVGARAISVEFEHEGGLEAGV